MKIARVFPRKTSMTPNDSDAYIGLPPLGCPKYDQIHISVTFTWDIRNAVSLIDNWRPFGKVFLGGPAYNGPDNSAPFEPSRYLRKGVTITSRGCPNNCPYCFVPKREGKLRELPIRPGHIVQDNNLLACSKSHIRKVFKMLKAQPRAAVFPGGLEAARITDPIIDELRSLRIKEVWLSYDWPGSEPEVKLAIKKLRSALPCDYDEDDLLRHVRCYVLVGQAYDTIERAETRLEWILEQGAMPFAMRYRIGSMSWSDSFVHPEREWSLLARRWSRPAIMMSLKRGL